MYAEPDYVQDAEFKKLVVRQSDVKLGRVALELARDAYPALDLNESLAWIRRAGRGTQTRACGAR